MNVAYSKRYHDWRKKHGTVFRPECLCPHPQEMKLETKAGTFVLNVRNYKENIQNYPRYGSICELQNSGGKVLYRWCNLDNDLNFFRVIHHNDGTDYLIFRQNLYGYSVLNLQTMQDFHYIPDNSFPPGKKNFAETFIWTDAFYEPQSSLLAVSGCFWARPCSIIVLDFSQPMKMNENWVDIHLLLDADYDIYEDINFLKWADEALILKGVENSAETFKTITLPVNILRNALEKQELSVML